MVKLLNRNIFKKLLANKPPIERMVLSFGNNKKTLKFMFEELIIPQLDTLKVLHIVIRSYIDITNETFSSGCGFYSKIILTLDKLLRHKMTLLVDYYYGEEIIVLQKDLKNIDVHFYNQSNNNISKTSFCFLTSCNSMSYFLQNQMTEKKQYAELQYSNEANVKSIAKQLQRDQNYLSMGIDILINSNRDVRYLIFNQLSNLPVELRLLNAKNGKLASICHSLPLYDRYYDDFQSNYRVDIDSDKVNILLSIIDIYSALCEHLNGKSAVTFNEINIKAEMESCILRWVLPKLSSKWLIYIIRNRPALRLMTNDYALRRSIEHVPQFGDNFVFTDESTLDIQMNKLIQTTKPEATIKHFVIVKKNITIASYSNNNKRGYKPPIKYIIDLSNGKPNEKYFRNIENICIDFTNTYYSASTMKIANLCLDLGVNSRDFLSEVVNSNIQGIHLKWNTIVSPYASNILRDIKFLEISMYDGMIVVDNMENYKRYAKILLAEKPPIERLVLGQSNNKKFYDFLLTDMIIPMSDTLRVLNLQHLMIMTSSAIENQTIQNQTADIIFKEGEGFLTAWLLQLDQNLTDNERRTIGKLHLLVCEKFALELMEIELKNITVKIYQPAWVYSEILKVEKSLPSCVCMQHYQDWNV